MKPTPNLETIFVLVFAILIFIAALIFISICIRIVFKEAHETEAERTLQEQFLKLSRKQRRDIDRKSGANKL